MMPGGHLVTAVALGGTAYLVTGSTELSVGCFVGGFLIDVDHYLDYLVFEKQWRRPGPASFLRYYFKNELQRVVLPLHSLELMTLLTGTIEARDKVLVKLNVSRADYDRVLPLVPALKAPTVSELAGDGGYAIETVVPKNQINTLIPALKDAGATGILELPISKIVH